MPGRRWIMLAILFAARAATGFQFQSVGSSAPMLMRDLAIDYSEIGLLLGAYLLPGVIVALPAGLLGQRFQEKTLGLAGLALMVISGVALSVCDGCGASRTHHRRRRRDNRDPGCDKDDHGLVRWPRNRP